MELKTKTLSRENLYFQAATVGAVVLAALALSMLLGEMSFAADVTSITSNQDEILQTSSGGSFREFITTVLNFVLGFLGLLAVGFMIGGGIMVVTAGGEDGIEKGKSWIKNAVIGLIIIAVSYALVNTILVGLLTGGEA